VADHLARQRPSLTCAVRLVRETGRPIAQVARDLGINVGTLMRRAGVVPLAASVSQRLGAAAFHRRPAGRAGYQPGRGRHVRQLPATPQVLNLATTRAGVPGHREQEQSGNTRATGRRCSWQLSSTFAIVKAPAFSAVGAWPSGCGFFPPVAGNQQLVRTTVRIRARL
jgi:hypothetical protein